MPYTIWNGLNLVLLLGELLYENSACRSAWSHCFGWSTTNLLKMFSKLLFVTLVYPFVCGRYSKLKLKFVPFFFHKVLQKCLTYMVSQSKIILLGNPCNFTIPLKNKLATWVASLILKQGIKWAIFKNISTTTKIESWPLWVLGIPKTKSILITFHGQPSMGNSLYNRAFYIPPLAYWHILHFSINLLTSTFMPGQ